MRRICIFAHYNINGIVADYVFNYISQLSFFCENIIFVSSTSIDLESKCKLSMICSEIIERDNIGYDFGSWREGILSVGFDEIRLYDELIIANDSCFTPLFPFEETFNNMETRKVDFWGITDCIIYSRYIESYFIAFRNNVVSDSNFHLFWEKMSYCTTKHDIVVLYEQGISKLLLSLGYKMDVYIHFKMYERLWYGMFFKYKIIKSLFISRTFHFNRSKIASINKEIKINKYQSLILILKKIIRLLSPLHFNSQLLIPNVLIKKRCPCLKKMLWRDNPLNVDLENVGRVLETRTQYDIELLKNYCRN